MSAPACIVWFPFPLSAGTWKCVVFLNKIGYVITKSKIIFKAPKRSTTKANCLTLYNAENILLKKIATTNQESWDPWYSFWSQSSLNYNFASTFSRLTKLNHLLVDL